MKKHTTLILVLALLSSTSVLGQVLSDDGLYASGYNEVQNRNWPAACAYLFAYIQRNPVVFVTDKDYEKQVRDAYTSSKKNIESEKNSLQNEITRLNKRISALEAKQGGLGSTSQGITFQPEIPPLKHPSQQMIIRVPVPSARPIKGQWQATLTSSSGSVFTGNLIIVTNEDVVTATFTLSDNSKSKVTGMYDGENLVLMRNTGVTTIQTYAMKKLDENHFSGLYKNEGRTPDDGKIELVR